jgi:hypothetical protein
MEGRDATQSINLAKGHVAHEQRSAMLNAFEKGKQNLCRMFLEVPNVP